MELRQGISYRGTVRQIEGEFVLSRPLTEKTEKLNGDLHSFAAIASGRSVPTYGKFR